MFEYRYLQDVDKELIYAASTTDILNAAQKVEQKKTTMNDEETSIPDASDIEAITSTCVDDININEVDT